MEVSYSVENLRSLEKMDPIELKPITVLVGANSTGKSSFLKSFPLLRQSLESRSATPILWFGDLVDFGEFSNAVRNYDTKKEISFSFLIKNADISKHIESSLFNFNGSKINKKICNFIKLTVFIGIKGENTVINKIHINISSDSTNENNINVKMFFNGKNEIGRIVIDKEPFNEQFQNVRLLCDKKILPSFRLSNLTQSDDEYLSYPTSELVILNEIFGLLKKEAEKHHKRIKDNSIYKEIFRILNLTIKTKRNFADWVNESIPDTFEKIYEEASIDSKSDSVDKIDSLCAIFWVLASLNCVRDICGGFFMATTYIGPNRGLQTRINRLQELEDIEILPNGRNLHLFLSKLEDRKQLVEFSNWVHEIFDFKIGIKKENGGVSITIEKGDMVYNISDAGHGLSFILPVIVQIWLASRKSIELRRNKTHPVYSRNATDFPVTIEEPELHQHPDNQAMIADAIAYALRNSELKPRFLIETHSEAFVCRLGELIENKEISQDDVQVVMFENDSISGNTTKVSISQFDDSGVLDLNWQYGFFEY